MVAKGVRPKRVPERTCVACRTKLAKRQLVRVVRAPAGPVEVDTSGKRAGRGAYVHMDPNCWRLALSRGQLEHSLKVKLSAADRAGLESYAASLSDELEEEAAQT